MTWTTEAILWLAVWLALGAGVRLWLTGREQQQRAHHRDHS